MVLSTPDVWSGIVETQQPWPLSQQLQMKALDKDDFLGTNGPDRYWEKESQTWMCRNLPKLAAMAMDRFLHRFHPQAN